MTLALLSLAQFLVALDYSIIYVALPSIGRDLGLSPAAAQWVISAYVLTYASLLLASGNYADLRGRKKSMIIGLVIFATSSAICGLASGSLMLNVARAARVVELHYFAGLTLEQIAEMLELARRTIDRDWRFARAFLHDQLR